MHPHTIYVLEKGRIVESGTHHAFLQRIGLYYAMWQQQIGEREDGEFHGAPVGSKVVIRN